MEPQRCVPPVDRHGAAGAAHTGRQRGIFHDRGLREAAQLPEPVGAQEHAAVAENHPGHPAEQVCAKGQKPVERFRWEESQVKAAADQARLLHGR